MGILLRIRYLVVNTQNPFSALFQSQTLAQPGLLSPSHRGLGQYYHHCNYTVTGQYVQDNKRSVVKGCVLLRVTAPYNRPSDFARPSRVRSRSRLPVLATGTVWCIQPIHALVLFRPCHSPPWQMCEDRDPSTVSKTCRTGVENQGRCQ